MRTLFSLLFWTLLVGAGLPATAATVSGVVSGASVGQPLAGATVTLSRFNGLFFEILGTTTTNAQGGYAISHAYVGEATVKATADGFVPLESAVSMPAGNGVVTVNLALLSPAIITGEVADALTGSTLTGKTVRAHSNTTQFLYTETDGDGRYAFTGLPPGRYSVCVMDDHDAYMNQCWDHVIANAFNFPDNFTPIDVVAGESRGRVDFDLSVGAHISGVILNRRTGLPPANAPFLQILLRTAALEYIQLPVQLDADGRYRIAGLAPGTYQATAQSSAPYYTSQLYAGIDCVDATCNYPNGNNIVIDAALTSFDDIDFSIAPGGRLQGRVLDRDTLATIADAPVELWRRWTLFVTPFQIDNTQTDAQGYYAFDHVNLAQHLVVVRAATHIPQRYPDVPCFTDCMAAAPSGITVPLNATMDLSTMFLDRGVRISGQAHLPGLSATTFAVSLFDAADQYLGTVNADARGAYQFPAWVPGTYFLIAAGGPQCQLYRWLPCMQPAINGTPAVLAAPGDSFTADFDLYVEDIHRAGFESAQ